MSEQLLYTAAVNFEAARQVLLLPKGHRSRQLHGHSFLAEVRCSLPKGWASFSGGEVEELKPIGKLRRGSVGVVEDYDLSSLQ